MKNPYDSQWLARYERRQPKTHSNTSEASGAIPKPAIRNESVAEKAREEDYTSRVSVRVVSYRTRLCDPDNLCPKYFIDCLRYSEIIKNDTTKHIALSVSQEKVKTKAEERTELIIDL